MYTATRMGVLALVCMTLVGCSEVILDSNEIETHSAGTQNFAQADVTRAATLSDAIETSMQAVPVRMDPVPGLQGAAIEVLGQIVLNTSDHASADRYDVTWIGLRTTADRNPTRITLTDASGERALRIDFERKGFSVVTGTIIGLAPIPYSRTKPHRIELSIRPGQSAGIDIKVTQDDNTLFERTGLEILDGEFGQLDAVVFDSPAAAGTYYAQDVLVEARG